MNMPEWLTTFLAALGSAAVAAIISSIVAKVQLGGKKIREKLQQERKDEVTEIVNSVIDTKVTPNLKSLNEVATSLNNRMQRLEDAGVASIRDQILRAFKDCREKGYKTDDEADNFAHLVDVYHMIGGNSFVDRSVIPAWKELPLKPNDYKPKVKKTTNKNND